MSTPAPEAAPDDDAFVRALVKTSRQRTVHLKWTDRDGTARLTTLTSAEASRVNALARAAGLAPAAFLRAAAHRPAAG
jgi:hypothetical protein